MHGLLLTLHYQQCTEFLLHIERDLFPQQGFGESLDHLVGCQPIILEAALLIGKKRLNRVKMPYDEDTKI